jgi:diguanylate cyclase (GGDEF)-like protein
MRGVLINNRTSILADPPPMGVFHLANNRSRENWPRKNTDITENEGNSTSLPCVSVFFRGLSLNHQGQHRAMAVRMDWIVPDFRRGPHYTPVVLRLSRRVFGAWPQYRYRALFFHPFSGWHGIRMNSSKSNLRVRLPMKPTFSEDLQHYDAANRRNPLRPSPGGTPAPLSTAELSLRLHTTLDVERILETFSDAIQWMVPHDGFSYEHAGLGLHVSRGRLSRHSVAHNLVVEGQEVGELTFLRGRKFQERELIELENLLAGLGYPLRNAVLHQKALSAAQTDPLTGLSNRAALDQWMPRELASFHRGAEPLVLLVLDLDHFKAINDTLGHSSGDRVLRAIADCLRNATRESDMVFRSGGEEFVILLRLPDLQRGLQAAERIRRALMGCPAVQQAAPGFSPTASIGITIAGKDDTPLTLFDRADRAMYAAKQAGRNRVEMAS